MSTDHNDDPSQWLSEAAEQLGDEFAGLFDADMIERTLLSSHERLAESGAPPDRLPVLARRFTRERLVAFAKAGGIPTMTGPAVLFVCTHNAGRSQMALAFFARLVGERASAWSGGSAPTAEVNPLVALAMSERGIDIASEFPKPWTDEFMRAADVVVDMGCGDTDPLMSGHRYEQWPLPDPAEHDIDEIRTIRDDIEVRVHRLAANLGLIPDPAASPHPNAVP